MGCIMVLVLAVYAYRHQIHRRSHQHMSPLAAQGESRMSLLTGTPHHQPTNCMTPVLCIKIYPERFRKPSHASYLPHTASSGALAPPLSHSRTLFLSPSDFSSPPSATPEMSVRMSNLDNERDERDEDSHEDRGISECACVARGFLQSAGTAAVVLTASLCFQSATLASSPPCWSATPTPPSAGGGTGDGPGRRAITVGPSRLFTFKL